MSQDFIRAMALRIKRARISFGATQAGLAKALGYKSSVSVMRWETGVSPVPVYQLENLAAALGVPVLHLLGMDNGDPYGAPAAIVVNRDGERVLTEDESERVKELEEANEFHTATIVELKKDNTAALQGIEELKAERVELHEENERLTSQLSSVTTGACYDAKCQLRAGHTGTHYDGQRRYYAAER